MDKSFASVRLFGCSGRPSPLAKREDLDQQRGTAPQQRRARRRGAQLRGMTLADRHRHRLCRTASPMQLHVLFFPPGTQYVANCSRRPGRKKSLPTTLGIQSNSTRTWPAYQACTDLLKAPVRTVQGTRSQDRVTAVTLVPIVEVRLDQLRSCYIQAGWWPSVAVRKGCHGLHRSVATVRLQADHTCFSVTVRLSLSRLLRRMANQKELSPNLHSNGAPQNSGPNRLRSICRGHPPVRSRSASPPSTSAQRRPRGRQTVRSRKDLRSWWER